MPTVLTHAVVGLALGKAACHRRVPWKFWALAAVCAALPDIDVALVACGVPFASVWGHRGMTHSLLFAAIIAVTVVTTFFRRDAPPFESSWWRLCALFFVVIASHGLLDACTNGGIGVAFFAPFDDSRYFFAWRPIRVAPVGIRSSLNARLWSVLSSEIAWVWLPTLTALIVVLIARRFLVARTPGAAPAGAPRREQAN
jgi:inner membrane protein